MLNNYCAYIYRRADQEYLLYACASPSNAISSYALNRTETIIDKTTTIIHLEARLDQTDYSNLINALGQNAIELDLLNNLHLPIIERRSLYQIARDSASNLSRMNDAAPESLGGRTNNVEVFYTEHQSKLLDLLESMTVTERLAFEDQILKKLETNLQLSFSNAYRYRLGCIEVQNRIDYKLPIIIHEKDTIRILRPLGTDDTYYCHIVLRKWEEIVFDRLFILDKPEISTTNIQNNNSIEINIFNSAGELLDKVCTNFMESMSIGSNFISSQAIYIDDNLTKKLQGKPTKEKARTVYQHVTHSTSEINLDESIFKKERERIRKLFFAKDHRLKGEFYAKVGHLNEKGEAFSWLIDLINESEQVTIVDPYFSNKAVTESLRRVRSDIIINVITSLGTANEFNEGDTIHGLMNSLEKCGSEIVCKLTIENFTKQNGEKLFHDRFLICQKADQKRIYMLSNSLSGYCEEFPFTYMPLDYDTSKKVFAYIEDIRKSGTVNELWDYKAGRGNSRLSPIKKAEDTVHLRTYQFKSGLLHIMGKPSFKTRAIGIRLKHLNIRRHYSIVREASKHHRSRKRHYLKHISKIKFARNPFGIITPNLNDLFKKSHGLLIGPSTDFKVDINKLSKLVHRNIFQKSWSKQAGKVANVLIAVGELLARCYSNKLQEEVAAWVRGLRTNVDLQAVATIIIKRFASIIPRTHASDDISYPTISKTIELFDAMERACKYGLGYSHRYWGLYYSIYFLFSAQQLKMTSQKEHSLAVHNLLAAILSQGLPQADFIDSNLCSNLLQSSNPVLKIFGIVYVCKLDQAPFELIRTLAQNNVSGRLQIIALVRLYKELIHTSYQNIHANKDNDVTIAKMKAIADEACNIWNQTELNDDDLETLFYSTLSESRFALMFSASLIDGREKFKFYKLLLGKTADRYGWTALASTYNNMFGDRDFEELEHCIETYLCLFRDDLISGLYEWNRKFIIPAKKVLNKPLYFNESSKYANRLAILLYFVSAILVEFIQRNPDRKQKITAVFDHLHQHTLDLFESEKCEISPPHRIVYQRLLFNLAKLHCIHGNYTDYDLLPKIFPFSNYMLCTAKDDRQIRSYLYSTLSAAFERDNGNISYVLDIIHLLILRYISQNKKLPCRISNIIQRFLANIKAGVDLKALTSNVSFQNLNKSSPYLS